MNGYEFVSNFIEFDLTSSPFEDQAFDLIICNHVLEHISDEGLAIREIQRLMTSQGIAILQVPIAKKLDTTFEDTEIRTSSDRLNHYGQEDHVRLYGTDYKSRLERYGLSVAQINIYNKYERFGINEKEDIFIASERREIADLFQTSNFTG